MTADTITAIKKAEHERIWLEPHPGVELEGCMWCQDNQWGDDGVEYVLASTLESLQRENEDLKRRLFPYADKTEISGISWDGKYLIGDKASISAFREMQNRGLQIDVYKRAYDEKEAALQARAEAAEAEVKRLKEERPYIVGFNDGWQSAKDDGKCPICDEPFKPDDLCATDIEMSVCHAACLEGSPIVDLETGEPSAGPIDTYRYYILSEPFRDAQSALSSTGDTHGN